MNDNNIDAKQLKELLSAIEKSQNKLIEELIRFKKNIDENIKIELNTIIVVGQNISVQQNSNNTSFNEILNNIISDV